LVEYNGINFYVKLGSFYDIQVPLREPAVSFLFSELKQAYEENIDSINSVYASQTLLSFLSSIQSKKDSIYSEILPKDSIRVEDIASWAI
jgi:hypothetical protein